MTEFTDKQLIEKYIWMRDLIAVKKDAYNKVVKPYVAGMEVIEKALLARLIQRGSQNTKTDAGTAFKQEILNVRIADRDAYLQFVRENWDDFGNQMMQLAAPQKDAVRDYIDKYKAPPTGVEISYFTNVNVRKS